MENTGSVRQKTIYELELHECRKIDDYFYICRVPGGWIYEIRGVNNTSCIFVPYNDEFNIRKPKP
jgi:hypothetical protein